MTVYFNILCIDKWQKSLDDRQTNKECSGFIIKEFTYEMKGFLPQCHQDAGEHQLCLFGAGSGVKLWDDSFRHTFQLSVL